MNAEWLIKVLRHPIETMQSLFSFGILMLGLYLTSPWYQAGENTPVGVSLTQRSAEIFLGLCFVAISYFGLRAIGLRDRDARERYYKLASFGTFLGFLFLVVLRLITIGFVPFTWVPTLLVSLASGLIRLYLAVRHK